MRTMANAAEDRSQVNMKVILQRLASASAELERSAASHRTVLEKAESWDRHLSDTSTGINKMASSLDAVVGELREQAGERRELLKLQAEERRHFLGSQDPRKTVPLSLVMLLFGVVGVLLIFDRVARTDRDLELDGTRLRIYRAGQPDEAADLVIEKKKTDGNPPPTPPPGDAVPAVPGGLPPQAVPNANR